VFSHSKLNSCKCRKHRELTFLCQREEQPRFISKKKQKFCSSSQLHVNPRALHPGYRIGTWVGRHNGQRRKPEISPSMPRPYFYLSVLNIPSILAFIRLYVLLLYVCNLVSDLWDSKFWRIRDTHYAILASDAVKLCRYVT